jgi:hypothetical protein
MKQPPYLYDKLAQLIDKWEDNEEEYDIAKQKLKVIITRRFRITKEDVDEVFKEMQKFHLLKDKNRKKITLL